MSDLFITNTKRSGRPRRNYTRGPLTNAEKRFVTKFVDGMVRDKQRFSVVELQSSLYAITGKIRNTTTIVKMVNALLDDPKIGYKPSWFKRQAVKLLSYIK
tara:strand:- start:289 stop:591 length:303 start_codon:yes stop_codon:yes gene_type:complete